MGLRLVSAALALFAGLAASPLARAQDASLGCKSLLCAAATNPDWSGIPYCVPPMTELFNILENGGGWPSCPEGDVSGVQYTPYKACPTGWLAGNFDTGTNNLGFGNFSPDPNGGSCLNPNGDSECHQGNCQTTYASMSRPTNAKPYCVDIGAKNGSAPTHFCFALSGG